MSWRVIRLGGRLLRRLWICLVGMAAVLELGTTAATAGSMLVSLVVYAIAFGWKFAFGFILLLLVHELGHLTASKAVGLEAEGPMFVPFIGAAINLKQAPVNAKMEANIAIGGPAMGTLSALVCLAGYLWTDSLLMLVLSYTACLLNLFNLIPCAPLDGGSIAGAISPHLWMVGSAVLGGLVFYTHNVFLLVIFVLSLFRLWSEDEEVLDRRYYQLTMFQRVSVASWYFGLLAVLGVATLYLLELLH